MKRLLALWLAASTPFSALFFLIPFELYYTAQPYWDWNKTLPLTFAAIGALLYAAVCGLLFLLDRRAPRAAAVVAYGLCVLGVFVLLADVFAPVQTGLIDGSPLVSDEPLSVNLIEAAILIVLLVAAIRTRGAGRTTVAAATGLVVAVIAAGYFVLVALSAQPVEIYAMPATAPDGGPTGNVYHIVLDAAQTDAAMASLTAIDRADAFRGFTLFRNNISNYNYTFASFPSYMTGTFFESGSFEEWTTNSVKTAGLLRTMHDHGYAVTMYGYLASPTNASVNRARSLGDVLVAATQAANTHLADFVQIWVARVLPNVMTTEALDAGARLGERLQRATSATVSDIPTRFEEGVDAYSSVLIMKEAIADESSRPPNGQYVYIHLLIPHPPFVMDSDCRYDLGLRQSPNNYFPQLDCGLKLVADFLAELQRLGRYDGSTIVVHGDHGQGDGFLSGQQDRSWEIRPALIEASLGRPRGVPEALVTNPKDRVLSRYMALLMLKPKHRSVALSVSDRPSQLVDVFPTIAALVQVKAEAAGQDLLRDDPGPGEAQQVFWFEPRYSQPDIIGLRLRDAVSLPHAGIEFGGLVNDRGIRELPARLDIGIASEDGFEGRLRLSGFGAIESAEQGAWRWSMGAESEVVLRGIRVPEATRVRLAFVARPLTATIGNEITISSGQSSAAVNLREGFSDYDVELTLPAGVEPALKIRYRSYGRPQDLGMATDTRPLAVAWRRMDIAIVE